MPLEDEKSVDKSLSEPMVREPLRWLFTAFFKDGSTIQQNQSDQSYKHDPNAETNPSTFTDVLEREDELAAFQLLHVNGNEAVLVDLTTGAFIVNGTPLHVHNQMFDPSQYKLKLIYFRENRIELQNNVVKNEDGSIDSTQTPKRHYVNRYFIGWETEVNGKNKKVTLAVG